VVYHRDLHSQHLVVAFNIPPPTGGNRRGAGAEAEPEPAVPDVMMPPSSADTEPAEPSDIIFENLLSRAGVDAFLKSVKAGSFFSLPKVALRSSDVCSVNATLFAAGHDDDDDDADDGGLGSVTCSDIGASRDYVGVVEQASPHMFFRLLRTHGGRLHNVSSDSTKQLAFNDLVVSRHEVLKLDRATSRVHIAFDPLAVGRDSVDYISLLRTSKFHDAVVWKERRDTMSILARNACETWGVDRDMVELLASKLVTAGAIPGTCFRETSRVVLLV
jgi:hypothetical protein